MELRRWMRLVEEESAPVLTSKGSFKAPESKLDYDGTTFEKYSITQDGKPIGEVVVQRGKVITVRNIILFDEARTEKGVGKSLYMQLKALYKGKTIRSSYSVNVVRGQSMTGLSAQAVHMWDSMVRRGLAQKRVAGDRFFYEMT